MALQECSTASTARILDGSTLEGGGQLLRNAVSFSAILSRPITVLNIRANRSKKGLRPQHAAGLKLAAEICNAGTEGIREGSETISFNPNAPKPGEYLADPGTAGATTLLLQVALPCLLFSARKESESLEPTESVLILRGGTNAIAAPQIDFTIEIFLPFIRRHFNICPKLNIKRRGYFPRGGGEISVIIPSMPGPLPAISLISRGHVIAVRGRAYVAGSLPTRIAQLIADAARSQLLSSGIDRKLVRIDTEKDTTAVGNGSGIMLWAETQEGCIIGGSAIGVKGVNASQTGKEAADELLRNLDHGGCVDEYLQDQIIIFMSLAKGKSTVATGPPTLHTKTAIWLAEQLTGAKFHIEGEPNTSRSIISCEGIGFQPSL